MNLTKNEKTVMKFLLNNARTPDAVIARHLKISLQAVRNIRRKLESKKVINGYTALVNYENVGVNLFAIAMFKLTPQAWAESNEYSIKKMLMQPNVVKFYRIPQGDVTHIIHYGFKDIIELNNFFQDLQSKVGKFVELKNIYTVSN